MKPQEQGQNTDNKMDIKTLSRQTNVVLKESLSCFWIYKITSRVRQILVRDLPEAGMRTKNFPLTSFVIFNGAKFRPFLSEMYWLN